MSVGTLNIVTIVKLNNYQNRNRVNLIARERYESAFTYSYDVKMYMNGNKLCPLVNE